MQSILNEQSIMELILCVPWVTHLPVCLMCSAESKPLLITRGYLNSLYCNDKGNSYTYFPHTNYQYTHPYTLTPVFVLQSYQGIFKVDQTFLSSMQNKPYVPECQGRSISIWSIMWVLSVSNLFTYYYLHREKKMEKEEVL